METFRIKLNVFRLKQSYVMELGQTITVQTVLNGLLMILCT